MGDNNQLVRTPFGDGQILEGAGLTLTLDNCAFNPDGRLGAIGYTRTQSADTLASINTYTVFGSSPVKSPLFTEKFEFAWSLILDQDQWAILESMIRAQQFNVQTRQSAEALSIRLKDARKVLLEPDPRTRARMSSDPIPNLTIPVGFEAFYPQFNVLLSVDQAQVDWLMDKTATETLLRVEMTGKELDLVPSSEDSDDQIIPTP